MDLSILSIFSAVTTGLLLPVLSYLIVRRDQKIDETAKVQHEVQLELVRTQGEVKSLQVIAQLAANSVTRHEFESAMGNVQHTLDYIKDRLDRVQ
jgi:hypothetical protein